MTTEQVIEAISRLEKEVSELKQRVNEVLGTLGEVDERTKQFKRYTQTGHPDFNLGE